MSLTDAKLPPPGQYIASVRASCRELRESSGVKIPDERIKQLLSSAAFTSTFSRLSGSHGVAFPLNFPSPLAELNFLSILALLNFGSGYRVPLHRENGRGAYDNIRALLFAAYLSGTDEAGQPAFFSARGMAAAQEVTIAELMRVSVHVERAHETIAGITVGELGGPLYEFVRLVTNTLKETGEILVSRGCPDLGTFVLQCLQEAERAGKARGGEPDPDVALEGIVRAIPAFQDMATVEGKPVYFFKKALFLLHAIRMRFASASGTPRVPTVDTSRLPVYSDNVLPSLLVHLGVLDLSGTALHKHFPAPVNDTLLAAAAPSTAGEKTAPDDGPSLTAEEAAVLRAGAVDACERIVEVAHALDHDSLPGGQKWVANITLPEVDGWLWSVAKDRHDYRRLQRFSLRNTVFF